MRAPFQILGIPYRISSEGPLFCVLHRSDEDVWQFVAGGGEEKETPLEAARREIFEETGVSCGEIIQLTSLAYVPADCISARHRRNWPADTYVIPEYCFAFACPEEVRLSFEHSAFRWVSYADACRVLRWDSNRTALYELMCRLEKRE